MKSFISFNLLFFSILFYSKAMHVFIACIAKGLSRLVPLKTTIVIFFSTLYIACYEKCMGQQGEGPLVVQNYIACVQFTQDSAYDY